MAEKEIPKASEAAKIEELIAECTAPLAPSDGSTAMMRRNNLLLAAILRKLSER